VIAPPAASLAGRSAVVTQLKQGELLPLRGAASVTSRSTAAILHPRRKRGPAKWAGPTPSTLRVIGSQRAFRHPIATPACLAAALGKGSHLESAAALVSLGVTPTVTPFISGPYRPASTGCNSAKVRHEPPYRRQPRKRGRLPVDRQAFGRRASSLLAGAARAADLVIDGVTQFRTHAATTQAGIFRGRKTGASLQLVAARQADRQWLTGDRALGRMLRSRS
jgi:hypothetical protein